MLECWECKASMVTDVASAAKPHRVFRGVIWVSGRLLAAERVLVAGLMVLLTGLILLNVVTRYTRVPLYWIDEAAVYSVVFLTFIGASAMTRLRMDFAVTILTERFPEHWVRLAKVISTCLVLLFGLLLIWMCMLWLDPVGIARAGFDVRKFSGETFNFIYTERTQTLNWPLWTLYMIMPLFAVCMTIHSAANLLEDLGLAPRERQGSFLQSNLEGIN
jgi:TRAP-type C4-dicarboxylate transport system permease small subunit